MRHIACAALLAIAIAAPTVEISAGARAVATAATVPLSIETQRGVRRFHVEIARTGAEQERGLMFRKTMARDHGMIFPMSPPRPASFWMKNTLIPLDLVFIRQDGTIASIAARATPLSLATIDSVEPVAAVLELVGGEAARAGIAAGDRVRW